MSSFEVVVLALAPDGHILTFYDYYKRLGAARISVYYDGIKESELESECLEVIQCDTEFWSKLCHRRPAAVEDRQRIVYSAAYANAKANWLLVVDLDEFVFGDTSLVHFFSKVDKSVNSVRFKSIEAVYGPGQDIDIEFGAKYFRIQFGRLFGKLVPILFHLRVFDVFSRGIVGHSIGKHAVRTGLDHVCLDIHNSKIEGISPLELDASNGNQIHRFYLAHFFVINFANWYEKWERRLKTENASELGNTGIRMRNKFAQAIKQGRERELFEEIHKIGPLEEFFMLILGKIIRNNIGLRMCRFTKDYKGFKN